VEVGQQIAHLVVVDLRGGHHVTAVQDDLGQPLVGGGAPEGMDLTLVSAWRPGPFRGRRVVGWWHLAHFWWYTIAPRDSSMVHSASGLEAGRERHPARAEAKRAARARAGVRTAREADFEIGGRVRIWLR